MNSIVQIIGGYEYLLNGKSENPNKTLVISWGFSTELKSQEITFMLNLSECHIDQPPNLEYVVWQCYSLPIE